MWDGSPIKYFTTNAVKGKKGKPKKQQTNRKKHDGQSDCAASTVWSWLHLKRLPSHGWAHLKCWPATLLFHTESFFIAHSPACRNEDCTTTSWCVSGPIQGLSRHFIMLIVWPKRGLVISKCFYPDQNTTVEIKEREREREPKVSWTVAMYFLLRLTQSGQDRVSSGCFYQYQYHQSWTFSPCAVHLEPQHPAAVPFNLATLASARFVLILFFFFSASIQSLREDTPKLLLLTRAHLISPLRQATQRFNEAKPITYQVLLPLQALDYFRGLLIQRLLFLLYLTQVTLCYNLWGTKQ